MTVINLEVERARRQLEKHFNPTLAHDLVDLVVIYALALAALWAFCWII